jgi:hypothetical protein
MFSFIIIIIIIIIIIQQHVSATPVTILQLYNQYKNNCIKSLVKNYNT